MDCSVFTAANVYTMEARTRPATATMSIFALKLVTCLDAMCFCP
jgi:hypothetical protein